MEGPIAPQADITMGVKIVLLPASFSQVDAQAQASARAPSALSLLCQDMARPSQLLLSLRLVEATLKVTRFC